MNYSLHNHTYRCKHAKGDENNMVLQAIVEGFEVFGISDHVAYNTKATNYRMEFEERFDYLNTLQELKDMYKDKITLYRGFEAEYQKEFVEYLKDMFRNNQIDYLVLGQHYYNIHKPETYYGVSHNIKDVTMYVNHCIKAMESGLFLF